MKLAPPSPPPPPPLPPSPSSQWRIVCMDKSKEEEGEDKFERGKRNIINPNERIRLHLFDGGWTGNRARKFSSSPLL